jgi:enoyl-CoA hydratase
VLESVPADALDARVEELADRIAGVPVNQLVMQKLMVNQAFDNMGLHGTQILATVFDGITRHSPEGRWFQQLAAEEGFHTAVEWRDSGRWIPEGGAPSPT